MDSVMRVLHAMEELDHSELTRGNVKAATRAVESMHEEMKKKKGVDSQTDSFTKLLMMAEKGNWTELRNARNNGLTPAAKQELDFLVSHFEKCTSVTPNVPVGSRVARQTPDRGYPPQYTAESEKEYNLRKRESELEHRNRRPVELPSPPVSSDYDRYEIRRRDDPKQVSQHLSRLASERLRDNKSVNLTDFSSPQHVANMFSEMYGREWTDAYEELNKAYRDAGETIQHLAHILQKAYEYCQTTADKQMNNLLVLTENEMLYPNISQQSRTTLEAQVRPDRHLVALIRESDDMIKTFRKCASVASLPVIKWLFYEEVMKTLHPAQRPTNSQVSYIDKCVEVSWLMCTQTPPMYLEFCNKGDRPTNNYRPLTRLGNAVQHCVWPALFLHKGGALMEKGVAHLA